MSLAWNVKHELVSRYQSRELDRRGEWMKQADAANSALLQVELDRLYASTADRVYRPKFGRYGMAQ